MITNEIHMEECDEPFIVHGRLATAGCIWSWEYDGINEDEQMPEEFGNLLAGW